VILCDILINVNLKQRKEDMTMSLLREVIFSATKHADNAMNKWVSVESTENENHKTEIITFKAKKFHNRALKVYQTMVEIKNETNILVKNPHGEFRFLKSDIADIKVKMTCLFSVFYTVLSIVVGALLIAASISSGDFTLFIPSILLLAIPFYTALIRTVTLKLKNGNTVRIYYNLKEDYKILLSKLNMSN